MGNDNDKGVKPSMSSLQFVNVTPATQEEARRNRKVIRSAAMKTFRQNQKLQRMKFKELSASHRAIEEKTERETPPTEDDEHEHEHELACSSSGRLETGASSWLGSQPPSVGVAIASGSDIGSETTVPEGYIDSVVRGPSQTISRVISPLSPLGAGRIDPFRRYPIDETGPHINEIMDHSVSYLWPVFRPTSSTVKIAPTWYEKATQRPIVMHALLFGGAVHRDILRNPRLSLNNPVRLFHKVQTMAILKKSLENPADVAIDDVILAVLALSTNEVETMVSNMNVVMSPFNSPLTSVQWLDVYGRISYVKTHAVAMRSLVARRGGLEKVEFDGLPEVISYSDILGATQSLQKPHFPFLDRWIHEQDLSNHQALCLSQGNMGSGFRSILPCCLDQSTLDVLESMAALTAVIDGHCRGLVPISDMAVFIDSRNGIQHRLLSLPTAAEIAQGEIQNLHVYEVVRYAAIVYSVAVIFPLPPSQGIFRTLASRLRSTTEEYKLNPSWQSNAGVLLWSLIMGGIAALSTDDGTWYVQNLATVTISLNLSEWEEVVEHMRVYLWLDSACDNGGRILWDEVVRERIFINGYQEEVGEQNFR